jgi:hypothetical protein
MSVMLSEPKSQSNKAIQEFEAGADYVFAM